jgi:hypothetical protein
MFIRANIFRSIALIKAGTVFKSKVLNVPFHKNQNKMKKRKVLKFKEMKIVQIDSYTWVQVAKDIPDKTVRTDFAMKQLAILKKLAKKPDVPSHKGIDFFR